MFPLALAVMFMADTMAAAVQASNALLPVLSWNVHWQCGSDYVVGCRTFATKKFLDLMAKTAPDVAVIIELEADSNNPVNLVGDGALPGWNQVNGSCHGRLSSSGDALALLLHESYKIRFSGGGCLGGAAVWPYTPDARAFAVALVDPPFKVKGCELSGLCIIALHSPHVNITEGQETVEKVCGVAKQNCVVAAGDFNAPVVHRLPPITQSTVHERLSQLLLTSITITAAAPDVITCCYPPVKYFGIDDHVATTIPDASIVSNEVFPFQTPTMGDDTEEHNPITVTLSLPLT